ncbi:MAG: leucyl aminopeptidase family protein [Boseongicola sp.]|nr:leucyl aminopeptidase family protein [Boseongicola sp.]MDD9979516.1 leucyl aminopeptidase family protein [Boseongicola sp.]
MSFAHSDQGTIKLTLVSKDEFAGWLESLSGGDAGWIKSTGFKGGYGQAIAMPGDDGEIGWAVAGMGDERARSRNRFLGAKVRSVLPAGVYSLASDLGTEQLTDFSLGWLLEGYRFDRYAKKSRPKAELVRPNGVDSARLEAVAAGEALARDLINTPASDMGPDELEAAAHALAEEHAATIEVVSGDDLLSQTFPLVHAVGRASTRKPRLIDIRWGSDGPMLTLVGKGVCFDTGGLNLKPTASMALMKKDMGGSANVLGLAHMIMASGMQCQLRVLIPAVENSVAGDAFRPGDILTSRKGLTVEINNTDAEGRLVLADALTFADADEPDLIISMATLTGAARVAVGADLAPYYATTQADADAVETAASHVADPVWRMPFWEPYEKMIEPGIADLDNAPKGGFAGSITAALFLRRFVTETPRYMHFDIYGWCPSNEPGRPKGGVGQGIRALFEALPGMLSK